MNKKNKNRRIPELLAPAGSIASALTAFDCGADAVYAGLSKFNARERTENFTLEEMSKLIAYAHKISKKVYITFNTLIKESELTEAVEQLFEISKLKPDAVIVQDIGILRIIRQYFPNLEIHSSTQMGLHNSAGVNLAAKLGVKRAILERQVSLSELEKINKESVIETEIFIHGALCCSMSGNCLLSSWLGGWSGNRGKCKQPCRRRYYGEEGNGFFFSTKDLYSLDIIPKLKEIGIASLKIEGRLRKPDYVKSVVTAYRMMLDAKPNEKPIEILKKAKDVLSRSLGRKWSAGFIDREACKDVIQHQLLGVSGQPNGNVINVKNSGFNASLINRLHIGDRVRVQPQSGEEGPTLTITKLFVNNKQVNSVNKNTKCFIPCDKEIPRDGIIYKIGESGGDATKRIANLPLKSNEIDLRISISEKGYYIKPLNYPQLKTWIKETHIEEAKKKGITPETLAKEFQATANENFKVSNTETSISGNLFIPASELKQTRREFWNWLSEKLTDDIVHKDSIEGFNRFIKDYENIRPFEQSDSTKSISLNEDDSNPEKFTKTVHTLEDFNPRTKEIILPAFCFEYDLNNTSRKIRAAVKKGINKFRVTSLYGFELLRDFKNIEVTISFPLPICNSSAVAEIKNTCIKSKFKLHTVQAWVELEKEELNNLLNKSITQMEIYTYGRPHLLVTRAHIPTKGAISDSKGNIFFVIKDFDARLVYLYPGSIFQIPEREGVASFVDLTNASLDEDKKSTFNYEYKML